MGDMVCQFPPLFADRIEMLKRIETEIHEKQTLRAESQRLAAEAEQHKAKVEQLVQDCQEEIEHSLWHTRLRLWRHAFNFKKPFKLS